MQLRQFLTIREKQIFELLFKNYDTESIAKKLNIEIVLVSLQRLTNNIFIFIKKWHLRIILLFYGYKRTGLSYVGQIESVSI